MPAALAAAVLVAASFVVGAGHAAAKPAAPAVNGSSLTNRGGPRVRATAHAPLQLARPIVGSAATTTGNGYWLVAGDGGIFSYGDAGFLGSTGGMRLAQPVVGMAATPSGHGYWLVASDGGIFAFGDAGFYGSTGGMWLARPVVGMAATPSGHGYWLVASDGGIFAFGDAAFYGSTGAFALVQPVVGMAATPSGRGYRLVAADGGLFSFGDAGFAGSAAGGLSAPAVAIASSPTSQGYWIAAADGSVLTFGDARSLGTAAGLLGQPAVTLSAAPNGQTLWIAGAGGATVSLPHAASAGWSGSTSFSYLDTNPDGTPARWNPCAPIHYVTNLSGAPPTAAGDLAGALSRISAASGLSFVDDGATTEVPEMNRPATQARYGAGWAPLLIAWSTPAQSNLLPGGGTVGQGGADWVSVGGGPNIIVTGVVVVDAQATAGLAPGFGAGVTMGELLLHEVGHAVGLGHTSDTSQIMYPDLTPRPSAAYGAGDLAGLAHLGAAAGCLNTPAPR